MRRRFKTDPATGFPEVEDRQFWRVSKSPDSPYVRVQLRERIDPETSTILEWTVVREDEVTKKTVYLAAESVLNMYNVKMGKKNQLEYLLGDYPPKRMES